MEDCTWVKTFCILASFQQNLERDFGTVERSHYCNLELIDSSHGTNQKKKKKKPRNRLWKKAKKKDRFISKVKTTIQRMHLYIIINKEIFLYHLKL